MTQEWLLPVTLAVVGMVGGGAASAAEAWEAVQQRIEKHRKADATVVVRDAKGKPVAGAEVTVKQVRHAFLFGCNIFRWGRLGDEKLEAAYRRRFADLLNYATLGFYWPSYEHQKGKPNHEYTERVARWCKANAVATKGHPLAWNYADAPWYPTDADQLRRLQMARIEDCVSRFRGLIDRWDVVNEAAHFDRGEFVRRAPRHTAMWKEVGQMVFTRQCFLHARKAAPQATLLINDYRTDAAYEKVIRELVDPAGKRMYDVIGIQSHMHGGAWSDKKIWDVCQRFAKFSVPLHFTEVTILSGQRGWNGPKGGWPSTPEGEKYQAENVVRFYTMLFSHPAVEAITWWDFSDNGSWKRAPAGFVRKDMTPKPAYEALRKLVKGKWWTRAMVRTDAAGTAAVRGFLGEYEVDVAIGGKTVTKRFTLGKGEGNRWEVGK